MAASQEVIDFLQKEKVAFELLEHPAAYTAQEIAGKQHISGEKVVKSVIVKVDGRMLMCILPAIHMVDFDSLKRLTGASDISLASEAEVAKFFPEYEVGAEPPFGHLHGMEVYVDKFLENDDEIVFNAGTHTDMVKIKYSDYISLVNPVVAEFCTHI